MDIAVTQKQQKTPAATDGQNYVPYRSIIKKLRVYHKGQSRDFYPIYVHHKKYNNKAGFVIVKTNAIYGYIDGKSFIELPAILQIYLTENT